MRDGRSRRTGPYHELPLVVFTALVTAGGGIGSAHLLGSLLAWWPWVPLRSTLALTTGLTGLGLLVSLGHLGRPVRGPRVLSGLGRSFLSTEVVLVGLMVAAGLLAAVLGPGSSLRTASALLAVFISPLVLVSLGLVYRLPGQLGWRGPAPVQPLVSGFAVGLLGLMALSANPAPSGARHLAAALLVVDGLVFWGRWRRNVEVAASGEPAHPRIMAHRRWISWIRVSAADLVPVLAVYAGNVVLAAIALGVGLLVDRFLFYGLAVRASTEAEIARVERILWTRSEPSFSGRLEGASPSPGQIPRT